MKAKTVLRKIVALGSGATMMGATLMGAMALDLGDYPAPFVTDGIFSGKIVIGDKAAPTDVIGAIDIAASLQRAAVTETAVGGGSVATSNGKVEDILIETALATSFGTSLDDTDLPFLADSSVTIDIDGDSDDFDYHEEIQLDSAVTLPATVETGLTYSSPDEDWQDRVFIPLGLGSIGYYFVFDETLDQAHNITQASDDDPIQIDFMGRNLKITGATATTITVQVGNEYFMSVGDVQEVEGKEVKLVNVASSGTTAVVEVDGVRETVSGTETVNGLRVKVQDTFSSDTLSERSATLVIGDEATKTYSDGEEYIGEDEDDPAWIWDLASLNTGSPTLGVEFALNLDTDDENDNPAYEHPLYEGDSLTFPGGFAEVKFDSLNQDKYVTYEFKEDTRDLYQTSSSASAEVSSGRVIKGTVSDLSNSGFLIGSEKADTVYLYPVRNDTISVYYKSSSNSRAVFGRNVTNANELFRLDYGKSSVNTTWTDVNPATSAGVVTDSNVTFTFASGDVLQTALETSSANQFTYLGAGDDDSDLALWAGAGTTGIASWEEDTRTDSGVVIYDPDSVFQKSSGSLKFDLPSDVADFRANVVIQGKGGRSVASGATSVSLNPIAVGMAVLASNAPTSNFIAVGGPCANAAASSLAGNPADCAEGFEEGKATIKLYPAKNALLVAGATAADTTGATRVLANYEEYADELAGKTEVTVVTTNLNNLQVMG